MERGETGDAEKQSVCLAQIYVQSSGKNGRNCHPHRTIIGRLKVILGKQGGRNRVPITFAIKGNQKVEALPERTELHAAIKYGKLLLATAPMKRGAL